MGEGRKVIKFIINSNCIKKAFDHRLILTSVPVLLKCVNFVAPRDNYWKSSSAVCRSKSQSINFVGIRYLYSDI